MPGTIFAETPQDSLLLERIFSYRRNYASDVEELASDVYMKWHYNTVKRNALLWFIPHMDVLARGNRSFISESFHQVNFHTLNRYDIKRKLVYGTTPRNVQAMPILRKFLAPSLYDVVIFGDHILSPFHRSNQRFYDYKVIVGDSANRVFVGFSPYYTNTQLISGYAIVDQPTGRIIEVSADGEYDMMKFHTEATQGNEGARSLLPSQARTDVVFKFAGNHISSSFDVVYDTPLRLPDSLGRQERRQFMDSLRPIPLTMQDKYIYEQYDREHPLPTDSSAALPHKKKFRVKKLAYSLSDNLVNALKVQNEKAYVRMSPIISPQYVSYSPSKGLAYKMKLRARYNFDTRHFLSLTPRMGYNFKQRRFYFTVPLQLTYLPDRNGYVFAEYGNGNRMSHNYITESIVREYGDSIDMNGTGIGYFRGNHLRVVNNIRLVSWMDVEGGFIYHWRNAENKQAMQALHQKTKYLSFAPTVALKMRPLRHGPVYTLDYERGIKGVNDSELDYERWELDAVHKHGMGPLRSLNVRLGGGWYTRKRNNSFVDFTNFRDNNLPGGWNDDWTGNFQLLSSRLYYSSKYYARSNLSYESPFIFMSWLPIVGRYIERERFYLSTLLLDHIKPYNEVGYGLTNRLFSAGVFCSFLGTKFQKIECKVELELFQKW